MRFLSFHALNPKFDLICIFFFLKVTLKVFLSGLLLFFRCFECIDFVPDPVCQS